MFGFKSKEKNIDESNAKQPNDSVERDSMNMNNDVVSKSIRVNSDVVNEQENAHEETTKDVGGSMYAEAGETDNSEQVNANDDSLVEQNVSKAFVVNDASHDSQELLELKRELEALKNENVRLKNKESKYDSVIKEYEELRRREEIVQKGESSLHGRVEAVSNREKLVNEREQSLNEREKTLQQECDDKIRKAEAEVADMKNALNSEAKVYVEDAKNKYLSVYFQEMKNDCNQQMNRLNSESREYIESFDKINNKLYDASTHQQKEWITNIQDASDKLTEQITEQINEQKNSLIRMMQQWQSELYKEKYKRLASHYSSLYKTTNLEKVLQKEIIVFEEMPEDNASAIVSRLKQIDKSLQSYLIALEATLKDFGMYVYRPEVGIKFDEIAHITFDGSEAYDGDIILECIAPGIAKHDANGDEDEILVRAEVRVKES